MTTVIERSPFRLTDLHPMVRPDFENLIKSLEERNALSNYKFHPFEGFRSPERQIYLKEQKHTWVGPWRSAHQWGLAVDFVPKLNGKWTWEAPDLDWHSLAMLANRHGLRVPYGKDKCHVEATDLWNRLRAL